MERVEFIYFCLGALSLALGFFIKPHVDKLGMLIKQVFTRKNINPGAHFLLIEKDNLQAQIDELKEQLDNVAKNHYRREQNRKSNIRREVRDYLKELRNN